MHESSAGCSVLGTTGRSAPPLPPFPKTPLQVVGVQVDDGRQSMGGLPLSPQERVGEISHTLHSRGLPLTPGKALAPHTTYACNSRSAARNQITLAHVHAWTLCQQAWYTSPTGSCTGCRKGCAWDRHVSDASPVQGMWSLRWPRPAPPSLGCRGRL